ncbi:MAG: hypothetical protein ABJA87_04385 [bacterium]
MLRLSAGCLAAALVLSGCSTGSGNGAKNGPCVPVTLGSSAPSAGRSSGSAGTSAAVTVAPLTSLTAPQLAERAKAALLSAPSVRIAGSIARGGSAPTFRIDIGYAATGSSGTVSSAGYDFGIIARESTVWFRAPGTFWKQVRAGDDTGVRKVANKWLRGTSCDVGIKDYAGYASRINVVESLFANSKDVKFGERTTIDGIDSASLTDPSGTLYVAIADARPVRLVGVAGTDTAANTMTFTHYGTVPAPVPPPAAQSVDVSVFRR